jgi:hypothetical protein
MFSDMLQLEYKNLILLSLLRDSLEIKYILKVYKIKPVLYILCADGFWKIGLDFVLFIKIFLLLRKMPQNSQTVDRIHLEIWSN